jgi:hypothetical protein
MAKKKKKAAKKRTPMKLTPSRKARLIVMKILEYAETGGMEPEDCGVAFEAISACLISVADDPEEALSGLIDQIRTIIDAKVWKQRIP